MMNMRNKNSKMEMILIVNV